MALFAFGRSACRGTIRLGYWRAMSEHFVRVEWGGGNCTWRAIN
jgi:hypothetical protein